MNKVPVTRRPDLDWKIPMPPHLPTRPPVAPDKVRMPWQRPGAGTHPLSERRQP